MDAFDIVLAVIGVMVMGMGLVLRAIRHRPLSAPMLALLVGVVLGPQATGALDIRRWGSEQVILLEVARLVLAVGLTSTAMHLPPADPLHRWRTLAGLLFVIMPVMAFVSGGLAFGLLGLAFWPALLIGVIVMPTDPILARSVSEGEYAESNIPGRLRNTLLGESGLNDGLALPFVTLAALMVGRGPADIGRWFGRDVLWAVGGAAAWGLVVGPAAAVLIRWAEARHTMGAPYRRAFPVALGLFTLGATRLLLMDGVLAVFITAVAYSNLLSPEERKRQDESTSAADAFVATPVFFLIGLALPWAAWRELGWPAVGLAVLILLLRRLPAVLLLWPLLRRHVWHLPEAAFVGWFGPIGISALFYAMLAWHRTGTPQAWAVVSLVICASVLAHGATAGPATGRLGAYERRLSRREATPRPRGGRRPPQPRRRR